MQTNQTFSEQSKKYRRPAKGRFSLVYANLAVPRVDDTTGLNATGLVDVINNAEKWADRYIARLVPT